MSRRLTRRSFLGKAAAVSGAAAAAPFFPTARLFAEGSPNDKLRVAHIGVANRGAAHLDETINTERIVALVDVDDDYLGAAAKRVSEKHAGVKTFNDFRKMYGTMGGQIDAVFIAIPDHSHAAAAMPAIQLGKHVYVEKPMCHDLFEVRSLTEAARKAKVVTQLGCQGHSAEPYRRLVEIIQSGAIGAVRETHTWCWCTWNFGYGGDDNRPPAQPIPKRLHWDEWIGTAPYREYHDGLHPNNWRGWRDFGTGNLGDFGNHIFDGVFWALRPGHASSVELVKQVGGSADRYPRYNVIKWQFPARDGMPPLTVNWYDGGEKNTDPNLKQLDGKPKEWKSLRPAIVDELEKEHKVDLGYMATLYVGEKGYLHTTVSGGALISVPESKMKEWGEAPRTLRRTEGSHQAEFLRACRGGEPANTNFDYAGPMNEMLCLGLAAIRTKPGRKLQWDGPAMKFKGASDVDALLRRKYRQGWKLG